jgi:FlaA1/EpsC-like NDP-sugar epimerase
MNDTLKKRFIKLPISSTPRWIIILLDLIVSLVALATAYFVRFDVYNDEETISRELDNLSETLVYILLIKALVYYSFKIHKGLVRYTSLEDVKRIFFAVFTSSSIILIVGFIVHFYFDQKYLIPTSVIIVDFLASLILLVGFRFTIKIYYYEITRPTRKETKNILVYGAGVSGLIAKRTIEKDIQMQSKVVGFIDDNDKLNGNRLEGVAIFHTAKIKQLIKRYDVDEVILAIQHPNREKTSRIIDICLHYNVNVQRVPNFKKWINGEFSTKQIRKINIDDLLGRAPIDLDIDKIKSQIKGKVILVTGAAGSIGSGLVRQILEYNPEKVILLDQAESPLYDFQNELIAKGYDGLFEVVIGDIQYFHRMHRLFSTMNPEIVFHAAAYKHVPLMEDNPSEAISTNISGTKNLVDLADQFNVKKFVMISTDKAVNPTNVMGASKRIAEIYAQAKDAESNTQFVTTRFGNVLGSNGSVIPLFKKQIEQGGPITVTDENVTRYFMTIPEACQLVLEAGIMGNGGEIFVFDMGESVKIIDLAKKMVRLSGLTVGKDIEVKVIGLRPGEKLYEELLANEENTGKTHHPQIMIANNRKAELSAIDQINQLIEMFDGQNNEQIVKQMKCIVPEFISNNSVYVKLDEK